MYKYEENKYNEQKKNIHLPGAMPDKRADDSFRWLRCLEASGTVVDRVNIALHLLVLTGQIDSVAEAVVDMNPSMDEFVPHSAFFADRFECFCVDFDFFICGG